jgi:hypothetical protein
LIVGCLNSSRKGGGKLNISCICRTRKSSTMYKTNTATQPGATTFDLPLKKIRIVG